MIAPVNEDGSFMDTIHQACYTIAAYIHNKTGKIISVLPPVTPEQIDLFNKAATIAYAFFNQ